MSPVTEERYRPLWAAVHALMEQAGTAEGIGMEEGPTSEREAVQLGEHVVPAALRVALRAAELEHSGDDWAAHLSALSRLADLVHGAATSGDATIDRESWGRFCAARDLIAMALENLPARRER